MTATRFTVHRIPDIEALPLPAARAFPSLSLESRRALTAALGPRMMDPGSFDPIISFHSWLVRAGGLTVLVDTCIGNDKERTNRPAWHRRRGDFLQRLAAHGVRPEDVDIVLCTHLHADHVGWNTRLVDGKWVPTFPNARYLMAETEYRYLRAKAEALGAGAFHNCYPDSVLPVVEAGQAEMVSMDHRVAAGIQLEPAPGHTPGSVLIHLEDDERHQVCTGDLIHHPLQLAMPEMLTAYCEDPQASAKRRVAFCERYADTGTRVLTAHFPAPSLGCICREGKAFGFRFEESS